MAQAPYPEIQQVLSDCALTQSPAEVQGMAAGLCAAQVDEMDELWAHGFAADMECDGDLAVRCRDVLDAILEDTRQQLAGSEFDYKLLVDERTAADHAASISAWCQGFLYGFGLAGADRMQGLSAEGQEAIRDFSEIARLDVDGVAGDEDELGAIVELEEYLRMAAILILEDLRQDKESE